MRTCHDPEHAYGIPVVQFDDVVCAVWIFVRMVLLHGSVGFTSTTLKQTNQLHIRNIVPHQLVGR